MNAWKGAVLSFAIGFLFRFSLEALFPASPIGFDPMGYYVPMLYAGFNPVNFLPYGPIYYVIAASMNNLIANPILTIKILDSVLSGFFFFALFIFLDSRTGTKYALLFAGLSFFSYQSLMLTWGLERNLLAFSLFILSTTFEANDARKIVSLITLMTLAAFTDPAIVPVGFVYFALLSRKNLMNIVIPVYYTALSIFFILLAGGGIENFFGIFTSFFYPSSAFAYLALVIFLLFPFILITGEFRKFIGGLKRDGKLSALIASFIISSFLVLSFFPRYLAELSSILIISLRGSGLSRQRIMAIVGVILVVSASYVVLGNEDPSPFTNNPITVNSGEIYLYSNSFLQSTVPLDEAGSIVKLFEGVNRTNSVVVSMLYMVGFAYEAGIPPGMVINAGENYSLFISECSQYSKEGLTVYAVWWIDNGWYGIKNLPAPFMVLKQEGQFALFEY